MFIPPAVLAMALQGIQKYFSGGGTPAAAHAPPPGPPDFDFYAVPEVDIDRFVRAHPELLHYATFAEQLSEAGYHEYACSVVKQGKDLMRKYHGQRIIVCCNFRPM